MELCDENILAAIKDQKRNYLHREQHYPPFAADAA
jgi:hypothetical protein